MIPRTFIALFALVSAACVAALPQTANDSPATDFDAGVTYVEVDPVSEASVDAAAKSAGGVFGTGRPCRRLAVRQEWRDLSASNKRSYINAVKCLQNTRALNRTLPVKFNRYDEFVITHSNVAESWIHGVAQFLPWHRHFGYLYEQALKDCNYQGPFPYWDWTRDTNAPSKPFSQSPVFDPTTGFGGDGVPGTYTLPTTPDGATFELVAESFKGCVGNGPFANTALHVGPNRRFTDHCLVRGFDLQEPITRNVLNTATVNNVLSQTTYDNFWNALDGLPFKTDFRLHDSGHATVGGDMASFYTSNNDPLFYLHHASIDRIWWKWQQANLNARLYQLNGQTSPYPPYGSITLDYQLPFTGVGNPVTARNVMDPRVEPYCYTYAD